VGERERRREVVQKRRQVVALHEQGFGPETIASRLGIGLKDAQEIVSLIDEIHAGEAGEAREAG